MKNTTQLSIRLTTILVVLLFSNLCLFSQSISPIAEADLHQHLIEINKEWQYYGQEIGNLDEVLSFETDEQRIQLHLQLVHKILSQQNTAHLTTAQSYNRKSHLETLESYCENAIFPQNNLHKQRQPYFVDQQNNACAVGYLMIQDGQEELVAQINKDHNFDYLEDLVKYYPAIENWAADNGFTLAELAWIQPGYNPAPEAWHKVGNDGGIEGQINVMKSSKDDELLFMAGDFTSVDGIGANSIIAWDGNTWQTLGEGVTGEIFDLAVTYNGLLYVVGDFTLNSDPTYTNVAVWDGSNWTGLQQGEMEGSVRTIHVDYSVYIGGDFQKVNGQVMPYLARWYPNEEVWRNNVILWTGGTTYDTIHNAFSVDGAVHSIIKVQDRILVAGAFTQTAPNVSSGNINQIDTDYMAYWHQSNWETGFSGDYPEVQTVSYINGKLYLAGHEEGDQAVSVYTSGFWDNIGLNRLDTTVTGSIVHGFIAHGGNTYVYGNIANEPIVGTYSKGLVLLSGEGNGSFEGGGALFDKTVRASEVFQDNVYFAGDFTTTYGNNNFNGLAYSPLDATSTTYENNIIPVNIYTANKQLYIEYVNLKETTELQIFNLQGALVKSMTLNSGAAQLQENLSHFSEGIFVYQLSDGAATSAGKLAVY